MTARLDARALNRATLARHGAILRQRALGVSDGGHHRVRVGAAVRP